MQSRAMGFANAFQQSGLSHLECHRLLTAWGAAERAHIMRQYYPRAIGMFRDWEPPRDPEARLEREVARMERDWDEIARSGWAVLSLKHRAHRETIRRHYRDCQPVGRGARGAALDDFGRVYAAWAEAVEGPLNSL